MGWVLHVRLTGRLAPASTDARTVAQLLELSASPPDPVDDRHPLRPLLEAAAALTPRVEPLSSEEFFAGLNPHDLSRLDSFLEQLQAGPQALAVLAPSRLAARAAGVRFLCRPLPPGRGDTWSQPAPRFYRLLDPARFLAPLPVVYLWTLAPHLEVLQRLGLWRIGQISGLRPEADARPEPPAPGGRAEAAPIPSSLLVDALGATLAHQLVEASLGRDPTPVRIAFPNPGLQREVSLPDGFDGSELPGLLAPLAASLAQELAGQGRGASRLTLRLLPPAGARGSETAGASRQASRRFSEPLSDPQRLAREAERLARRLLLAPPLPGSRLLVEAADLAPAAARQTKGLVPTAEAAPTPAGQGPAAPGLAELLEAAQQRFGQAAPVPASTLPLSRRERMLHLWLKPPEPRPCGGS